MTRISREEPRPAPPRARRSRVPPDALPARHGEVPGPRDGTALRAARHLLCLRRQRRDVHGDPEAEPAHRVRLRRTREAARRSLQAHVYATEIYLPSPRRARQRPPRRPRARPPSSGGAPAPWRRPKSATPGSPKTESSGTDCTTAEAGAQGACPAESGYGMSGPRPLFERPASTGRVGAGPPFLKTNNEHRLQTNSTNSPPRLVRPRPSMDARRRSTASNPAFKRDGEAVRAIRRSAA